MSNFSGKNLSRNGVEQNKKMLSLVDPNEHGIELNNNSLGDLSPNDLAQVFKGIPVHIKHIELQSNNLGISGVKGRLGEDVAIPLRALNKDLNSLNLGLNSLGSILGEGLSIAIAAIPSVTTLGLGDNKFNEKTVEELKNAFSKLPDSVKTLDLSGNDFYTKSGVELGEIFSSLHVENLILRFNNLGVKDDVELEAAFSKLNQSVTTIDVNYNALTEAQLSVILKSAPHVQHIVCGTLIINRADTTTTNAAEAVRAQQWIDQHLSELNEIIKSVETNTEKLKTRLNSLNEEIIKLRDEVKNGVVKEKLNSEATNVSKEIEQLEKELAAYLDNQRYLINNWGRMIPSLDDEKVIDAFFATFKTVPLKLNFENWNRKCDQIEARVQEIERPNKSTHVATASNPMVSGHQRKLGASSPVSQGSNQAPASTANFQNLGYSEAEIKLRDQLCKELQKYADSSIVSNSKNVSTNLKDVPRNYKKGFIFNAESRGLNRKVNQDVAEVLISQLRSGRSLSEIFGEKNLRAERKKLVDQLSDNEKKCYIQRDSSMSRFFNPIGINSKTLNNIIEKGRTFKDIPGTGLKPKTP